MVSLRPVCGLTNQVLHSWGVLPSDPDIDEVLQRICGVLDVNCFEVRGPPGVGVGVPRASEVLRGVYPETALMAHDCVGNTHLAVDAKFDLTVHASVHIPAGQPIFYNYTSTMQGTDVRREHLREGKYFECSCPRCCDPTELGTQMSSLHCPRCHQGLIQHCRQDQWACSHCAHSYRPAMINNTVAEVREQVHDVDKTSAKDMEALMKKLLRTFPSNHDVMLELKQYLVAAYRDLILRDSSPSKRILSRKMELCLELLPVLEVIEPGISRLRGITLYELHGPVVLLANRDFQLGEIGGVVFLSRLREAEKYLRDAVTQLLYEPMHTPESQLARVAMQELKQLRKAILDAEVMTQVEKKVKKAGNKNKNKHK